MYEYFFVPKIEWFIKIFIHHLKRNSIFKIESTI